MSYSHTITEAMLAGRRPHTFKHRGTTFTYQFMGGLQPCDIGKRVYVADGVPQVENNQQRDERLARTEPDWVAADRRRARGPSRFAAPRPLPRPERTQRIVACFACGRDTGTPGAGFCDDCRPAGNPELYTAVDRAAQADA